MNNKEITKEAFAQAEKEAREKQVKLVKEIVTKTLEKIDTLSKDIKGRQEERKILELDINDLKAGKIDQIVERQEKSEKAKETSVVVIIKEKVIEREVPYNPWYWPYTVTWQSQPVPTFNKDTVYYNGTNNSMLCLKDNSTTTLGAISCDFTSDINTINCSVAKDATIGTYTISDHSVFLR